MCPGLHPAKHSTYWRTNIARLWKPLLIHLVVSQGMRQRFQSKYMDADEIDSILRIQWRSLHSGPPYVEDYYFQASLEHRSKHCADAQRRSLQAVINGKARLGAKAR